jgi:hypothetical protein
MKFLEKISESDKEIIKTFIYISVGVFFLLSWFYVAALFALNAIGMNWTFNFKFLIGLSMLFSMLIFLTTIEEKDFKRDNSEE